VIDAGLGVELIVQHSESACVSATRDFVPPPAICRPLRGGIAPAGASSSSYELGSPTSSVRLMGWQPSSARPVAMASD